MKESINILVVDDEPAILEFFERLLKMKGFGVKTVGTGAEALEVLSRGGIDLVITDIVMPKMNGFQVTDAVKKANPEMPVIVMTGRGDADMVRMATLHGADEYITKPFKREELSMVIERAAWKIFAKETEPVPDSQ